MSTELLAAATALVLFASAYICLRRGRHGGLAGGDSTAVAPNGVAEPGTSRTFTAVEVSHHSTPEDLWLIINGKVYDFSDVRMCPLSGFRVFRHMALKLQRLTSVLCLIGRDDSLDFLTWRVIN